MPHFHVPLQSGSNLVLKAMRRRYKRELYAAKVEAIKKPCPTVPSALMWSWAFPEKVTMTFWIPTTFSMTWMCLTSTSSPILNAPNTDAAGMESKVAMEVKRKKRNVAHSLSKTTSLLRTTPEQPSTCIIWKPHFQWEALMSGFTDNYIKVSLPKSETMINECRQVRLLNIDAVVSWSWSCRPIQVRGTLITWSSSPDFLRADVAVFHFK